MTYRDFWRDITILIIFFLILFGIILRILLIDISYTDVCKYQYGENYIFESDDYFGEYCIELVYKNLTKTNAKPSNFTSKEIREMCDSPKFFELNRWDRGVC